ncbi:hypothetical protein Vafri_4846, partial [Volvox africanus]
PFLPSPSLLASPIHPHKPPTGVLLAAAIRTPVVLVVDDVATGRGSAVGAGVGAAAGGGGGSGGGSGGPSDATVARIVAGVLSRLVDRVEVEARHQASREAAVAAVMQRMLWMVSRAAAREQLGLRRPGRLRLGLGVSGTCQTQPRGASRALSGLTEGRDGADDFDGDGPVAAVSISGDGQGRQQRQRLRRQLGGCGEREMLGV